MADRERRLRLALEAMTRRYPRFHDAEAVSRLITDRAVPNCEQMMLAAIVEMVNQCADRYEDRYSLMLDDGLLTTLSDREMQVLPDLRPMPAVVDAVNVLAEFGLMKIHARSNGSDYAIGDGVAQHGEPVLVTSLAAAPFVGPRPLAFCLAEWTDAGKRFFAESMQGWDAWEERIAAGAETKRKFAAKVVDRTGRIAVGAAYLVIFLLMAWIYDHDLRPWLSP